MRIEAMMCNVVLDGVAHVPHATQRQRLVQHEEITQASAARDASRRALFFLDHFIELSQGQRWRFSVTFLGRAARGAVAAATVNYVIDYVRMK